MKPKPSATPSTLQKGQLWKTKTARVEIMEMGKLLGIDYRHFVGGQKRVSTAMAPVRQVLAHLKANGGKLIKNDRLEVSG